MSLVRVQLSRPSILIKITRDLLTLSLVRKLSELLFHIVFSLVTSAELSFIIYFEICHLWSKWIFDTWRCPLHQVFLALEGVHFIRSFSIQYNVSVTFWLLILTRILLYFLSWIASHMRLIIFPIWWWDPALLFPSFLTDQNRQHSADWKYAVLQWRDWTF